MFYKKGLDISNTKECYEFLHNHFTYWTLNSWNGLKSIANNVKLYNLGLEGDWDNAYQLLVYDDYYEVNSIIYEWEASHPGYKVGFNGRSSGYLVLYRDDTSGCAIPEEILDFDYEDFKDYCKDYGSVKDFGLRDYAVLVRDFDKLCDELRDYVNGLSKVDATQEIISDVLYIFNDDYYEEFTEFGLDFLGVTKCNRIYLSDEMNKHLSLVDCLIERLKKVGLTVKNCGKYLKVED